MQKLLKQVYVASMKSSLQNFYRRHYNLDDHYEISISQLSIDLLLSLPRLSPDLTVRVSYKKQELLTLREHLNSSQVCWWGPCCSSVQCLKLSYYVLSSVLWCSWRFPQKTKRCSVRLYLQFFVHEIFLFFLCLFAYSGVQHMFLFSFFFSSCVPYVASFSELSILYCPFDNR